MNTRAALMLTTIAAALAACAPTSQPRTNSPSPTNRPSTSPAQQHATSADQSPATEAPIAMHNRGEPAWFGEVPPVADPKAAVAKATGKELRAVRDEAIDRAEQAIEQAAGPADPATVEFVVTRAATSIDDQGIFTVWLQVRRQDLDP